LNIRGEPLRHLLRAGDAIETISIRSLDLSLLVSGDGTEVIRHHLRQGGRWALRPEDGWEALEFILVTSGQLRGVVDGVEIILGAGDSLTNHPVTAPIHFSALKDAEFIYVCSRPVFHLYSKVARQMMELAVNIEYRDGYTAHHCSRITRMSMIVAEEMQLSSAQVGRLNRGAFLHDVGKAIIPLEILNKPGPLTPGEWEIMRRHPTAGREMLHDTGLPILKDAAPIVEQHHERWDGKGYPHGLKGHDILVESAIVAVVDAFDAMTTDRSYRKGMGKQEAIDELIRGRAAQFRPDVVDAFLQIKDKIN